MMHKKRVQTLQGTVALLSCVFALTLVLPGCGATTEDSEDALREALAAQTDAEPIAFWYDDFDSDGTHEAFAVEGELSNQFGYDYVHSATLWFVTPDGAETVPVYLPNGEVTTENYRLCDPVACGDHAFVHLAEGTQTVWASLVIGVRDGKPLQMDVSGGGWDADGFRAGSEDGTVIVREGSWVVEPAWHRDDVYRLNEDGTAFELVEEGTVVYE